MQWAITLKQLRRNNILKTLLCGFFLLIYVCSQVVLNYTNIILLSLHLDFQFVTFQEEQYADHAFVEVLLLLYLCPKVVLLDKSNIAKLHLDYLGSQRFLFLYVYSHEVILDISDIEPFAF